MNDERERLQAWLDQNTPSEADRVHDANATWSRRRPVPVVAVAVAVAVAASVAVGVWALRGAEAPARAPAYDSSLVMTVGDDPAEIRILVGVRREGER